MSVMKKLVGFASICIAVGMLLMLLLGSRFTGLVLMGVFALLGYVAVFCE
jgi:hypothetical protein